MYEKDFIEIFGRDINKIQHLSDRFTDIFIARDEIKRIYNLRVDNNSQDLITYHFNYWVILFVGVFDSFAIFLNSKYEINLSGQKIGLRKKENKEFRKILSNKNKELKNFLNENNLLVNLICDARNDIVHRERLSKVCVRKNNDFLKNMVKISRDFYNRIIEFSGEKTDNLNNFGHFKFSNDTFFLEPYRFTDKMTEKLIKFTNDFLILLKN